MSDSVRLVLTGDILPGHERGDVRDRLAALLKVDAARSSRLLDEAPTVIKQQLPLAQVQTYLDLLAKAGVGVRVEHLDGRPWLAPADRQAFPALFAEIEARPIHPASVTPRVPATGPAPAPAPVVAAPADAAPAAVATGAAALTLVEPEPPETICCPSCGLQQHKRTLCTGCGVDMPRMIAAQNQAQLEARQAAQPRSVSPLLLDETALMSVTETPRLFGLSLSGRLGRMRYLAYGVLLTLAIIPLTLLFSLALVFLKGFWVVFAMGWVWLFVRLMVFRLHDMNLSGWWVSGAVGVPLLVGLIDVRLGTMASALVTLGSLALCLWPGTPDDNRFGPPAEPPTMLINVLAVLGLLLSLLSIPAMLTSGAVPGYTDHVRQQKLQAGQLSDAQLEEMAAALRAEGVDISAAELREQMEYHVGRR